MKKQTAIISAVLIIIAIAIFFIMRKPGTPETMTGSETDTSASTGTNTGTDTSSTPPSDTGTSTTPDATVKTFTVTGSNFAFAPKTLSVNKGDTVKIIFKNSGGMHNFVLDEFGVRSAVIGSGQEATLQFIADKTGGFEYYCSVGEHRAMGMWGTLTVK